jgi:hypothetical protein
MARRVFFSFHYADVWRASQVRNSWVTKTDRESAGFWDSAAWEEVQKRGDAAVKRWIDSQLNGTSVTAVLIGGETWTRPYVQYEIQRSHEKGNGLFGVYIHNCKDQRGLTCSRGINPFSLIYTEDDFGRRITLSSIYPTYDWIDNSGYVNFPSWVDKAATMAGR